MSKPINPILRRKFDNLTWVDPKQVLINFRHVEGNLPTELSEKTKRLRTNTLKSSREAREAAIFAYGMSQTILGVDVLYSNSEESDYDFLMKWVKNDAEHYCPVQLKELPPEDLNPNVEIAIIIEKLNKYTDSENLVVAININRAIKGFKL